ncbi:MAG: hypothetical protein ACHQNV_01305 [Vicinamibacteria bacterium]
MALLALLLTGAWGAAHGEEPAPGVVIVTLADGTNLPLTSWSLSYEYQVSPSGAATFGTSSRREARDLFVGKRALATAGSTVEIQYREYQRAEDVDGQSQTVKVAVATGLSWTAGGKKSEVRIEPPHRDLLVPQGGEKGVVQARGLDLRGLTLTGTKRSFCLLAYTAQVECHPPASERVVKMDFQQ